MKGVKCLDCKNLGRTTNEFIPTCKAFPKGIPDEIFFEKIMHDKPYAGDNGIRFENKFKVKYK